jgi:predicted O-linked N-acetylglucosamine transferase (SPINDLY family)
MRIPQENLDFELQRAVSLHQAGRLTEAEPIYRRILRVQKHHPDATHLIAMLMHQKGDTAAALPILDQLLKTRPNFTAAHNSRGLILVALGRHSDAVVSFDRVVSADPTNAMAWMNRGNALAALREHREALASYDRAIAAQPQNAETYYAKGQLLQELGRPADACACYDRALAIRPDFPEARNNRAATLERLGRVDEALADYERAITLRPGFSEAWNNQGVALDRIGRHGEAIASFRRAIAIRPDFKGALMNLADILYVGGLREDAVATIGRCLAIDPTDTSARVLRMIYQLPIVYDEEHEITERRHAYEAELRALCASVGGEPQPGRFAGAIGAGQPFFLAYQGRSDVELQRLYGGLVSRIMSDRQPALPVQSPPLRGQRIRVGFVCGFFRQHPVWRCTLRGWVSQLDRSRFEVFGYHTGGEKDAETEAAAAMCERFVPGAGLSVAAWRTRILADAPHVLIYPEIGMDRTAALLAAQRLAGVQCMSWGHPDTSGLPTVDYFLSSAEMEPEDGDRHYSEKLVRLPGLGVYYEPRLVREVPFSRADMGVRPDVPVFWCAQSLFKYLPQHDEIYPRIAREVGDCQFAFISYARGARVTELFRARLDRAFGAFGLDAAAHCVILPRLDGDQFAAAPGQCDVVLDSIGWSGFNTNLEGFGHNKPVVTLAGPLMRGRHTTAIMRVMGLHDAIAKTVDDYVAMAVGLGRDPLKREVMGRRIAEAKHRVYRDRGAIAALEEFLESVVRDQPR